MSGRGPLSRSRYSATEDAIIRQSAADRLTIEQTAAKLDGRSIGSVGCRAAYLQIRFNGHRRPDTAKIERAARNTSPDKIALMLAEWREAAPAVLDGARL